MLTGYKTYILSAIGAAVVGLMFLGYVSADNGLLALGFLGFGSIAALRSAIKSEVLALAVRAGLSLPKQ